MTLDLNSTDQRQVNALDFDWDVSRPTEVQARQASLTDADSGGVNADTATPGSQRSMPRPWPSSPDVTPR